MTPPSGTTMSGQARVYFAPEPPDGEGHHPGVRGFIRADLLGIHLAPEVEWLYRTHDARGDVTGSEWEPMSCHTDATITLPWHRVHSIEWEADA